MIRPNHIAQKRIDFCAVFRSTIALVVDVVCGKNLVATRAWLLALACGPPLSARQLAALPGQMV